ncbi:aspartate/glutamate racemase family protein [Paraburkholderia sp. EG287A]|uniref:aspartate/glutamate racemase family protein n=1 Tax=unclassified Paraburkholderia TaxID=2615204 RepID=UPI0034D20473
MTEKVLGILELENRPMMHPGALSAPGTFGFPVKRLTVPGATTNSVVGSSSAIIKEAYIACAKQLESEGVSAIIANCGFSAPFQNDVAAAINVPLALSSLLLVPLLARTLPAGKVVGILTYDSTKLEERHFAGAGWSTREISVAVGGIEGSETWRELAEPNPVISPEVVTGDIVSAVESLMKANPAIGAIVLECAGFPLAADAVREATGLPVADYVSLGRLMIEMSPCL